MKTILLTIIMLFGASLLAQTPPLPDFYGVPHLQEALQNAEARYQAGGPGVTEEEIVTFHNHLVEILGMPEYAKLSQEQLRTSRMYLSPMKVFGDLTPKSGENPNEVTHILSPMAAAYLEDHMILQKRFNPGYQMAPGEWTTQKLWEHRQLAHTDQIEGKDSGVSRTSEIHKILRAKKGLTNIEAAKLLYYLTETFKLSDTDAAKIAVAALEGQ
jgi:hypothetical protein